MVLTGMSRHCTVIIYFGHCMYQWNAKFERPVLQFYMSDIACGSIMHLKILRKCFRENSASTTEYIRKCKILTKVEVVYFKVITVLNLFFLFYSWYDLKELLELIASVLILNVLVLLYFSLSFLKIKLDIKLYGHHLLILNWTHQVILNQVLTWRWSMP